MRVVVLSDNRTRNINFETEHGLSVYVEHNGVKWLLDTGKSDVFIRNAEKLNIDLSEVDFVFLSHGHIDHTGGLMSFFQINQKAQAFVSVKVAYDQYFSSRKGMREISSHIDFEKYQDRILQLKNGVFLSGGVKIFSVETEKYDRPLANRTLLTDQGLGLERDDFSHELVISFGTNNQFVFTGCGHKGLLNILSYLEQINQAKPKVVLGGFHLLDSVAGVQYESEEDILQISKILNVQYPETRFVTGHCTGDHVYELMKEKGHVQIEQFYVGYDLSID
ncbi:MAG: MBL fold metallo-hydrolase [Paludibacter sp.]|nr:MBL fold metallo-hydrolase [Paludibacter sp.]